MNAQLFYSVIFLMSFLMLVFITQLLHKKWGFSVEHSRKFLHISGGILALFFPLFIQSHWWVLSLCLLAFLLLFITHILKQLPSVHQTKRKSVGSIIFPIPVYICFVAAAIFEDKLLYFLPISLLSFADPVAEWGGKLWGKRTMSFFNHQKTLAGTLSFMALAMLLSIVCTGFLHEPTGHRLLFCFVVSLVTAAIETISLQGTDNITVPLSALVSLLLLKQLF